MKLIGAGIVIGSSWRTSLWYAEDLLMGVRLDIVLIGVPGKQRASHMKVGNPYQHIDSSMNSQSSFSEKIALCKT